MALLVTLFLLVCCALTAAQTLPAARPSFEARSFHSKAIDSLIDQLSPLFADENLAILFSNTLPNTLDTTVKYYSTDPSTKSPQELDSFVITGDIDALWLRDSMNQVLPYIPYIQEDEDLRYMIEGLINRHARSVLLDPFANAFNFNRSGEGHQDDMRTPPMTAGVFEGKYEIDSLCAFLKLSFWYTKYATPQGIDNMMSREWLLAVESALNTIELMRNDDGRQASDPYMFQRVTSAALDTLSLYGRGPPANRASGLSRSLFRPSDDAVTLPYNIPGNAMACVEVTHIAELMSITNRSQQSTLTANIAKIASDLANALCTSLRPFTVDISSSPIPYEIDGFRSMYFMDDANLPSLLSLPFIGFMDSKHAVYKQTRAFALSAENPYYFVGGAADGIGGPHVGLNYSWPMGIVMRAMTSTNANEIQHCLDMLLSTTAGTGFMHESFNVNNANDFTRNWFAWANGLFGELILQLIHTHPDLILKKDPAVVKIAQELTKIPISLLSQQATIF